MVPMDNPHVAQFEESLKDWVDDRFISRKQLRSLAMFNLYIVNLSEADGWVYDGHSLKVSSPICCLVVKATIEGTPHVVFTSARTPVGCVVTFIRKLEEELLEWRRDKFRG